jgi:ankyrin repeat protein
MSPKLKDYLETLTDLPGFKGIDSSNINITNSEGENALHIANHRGDTEAARLLIKEGIDIQQPGDLGHTPLHEACSWGNIEIVQLLIGRGADVFALTEGEPPFTLARYGKHDAICNLLGIEMKKRQAQDPAIWTRARIKQLQAEIARLERRLDDE